MASLYHPLIDGARAPVARAALLCRRAIYRARLEAEDGDSRFCFPEAPMPPCYINLCYHALGVAQHAILFPRAERTDTTPATIAEIPAADSRTADRDASAGCPYLPKYHSRWYVFQSPTALMLAISTISRPAQPMLVEWRTRYRGISLLNENRSESVPRAADRPHRFRCRLRSMSTPRGCFAFAPS